MKKKHNSSEEMNLLKIKIWILACFNKLSYNVYVSLVSQILKLAFSKNVILNTDNGEWNNSYQLKR